MKMKNERGEMKDMTGLVPNEIISLISPLSSLICENYLFATAHCSMGRQRL